MWKCSECGNLYFEEVSEETKQVTLDSNGLRETEDLEYSRSFIRCSVCENKGSDIFDIAEWVE